MTMPQTNLDTFTAAYIEAVYFTETGDGDQPSGEIEMSSELRDAIIAECAEWQVDNAKLLAEAYERVGYDEARAGHDFWLTRNGHGAGFWCRDELEGDSLGDRLSLAAKAAGVHEVYEGDDGLLY
jgi:hypothetical protein